MRLPATSTETDCAAQPQPPVPAAAAIPAPASAASAADFWSAYAQGFARVAAVCMPVAIGDPSANAATIVGQARLCHDDGVAVAVFPELCVSGYSIDDLVMQDALLEGVLAALDQVRQASASLTPLLLIGAPLLAGNRLYNCAVAIHRGRILGVAPKSYLPTYREFYERRWFSAGDDQRGQYMTVLGQRVPFGPDLIFRASDLPGLSVFAETCEDLWVPIAPSSEAALAGATVLADLSASPLTVGRASARRSLVQSASAKCLAAYVFTSPLGESTTDLAWDGHAMISECGNLLAENDRMSDASVAGASAQRVIADVDLGLIRQERLRLGTFDDNRRSYEDRVAQFRTVEFELRAPSGDIGLRRQVARFPFVPVNADELDQDCLEAYAIQVSALVGRLRSIGKPKIIIGVSGGLDSTQALLVAAQAMDRLGRPRSDILAYTLPGFATSPATKDKAWRLMRALGVRAQEIDIQPAARQMLADMSHPYAAGEQVYDVTFENVQAGLRTDYLFRLANHQGGIVLGTGDLSELALGWATYGVGDHMSHYGINAGIPKTLIQHLIRWLIAQGQLGQEASQVLQEIVDQEISPELIPASQPGALQATQDIIGPYELQDFTLYWMLRYGLAPSKIAFLQWHAWHDSQIGAWPPAYPQAQMRAYGLDQMRQWMDVFYRRFFANQFKRTALPNGPKVLAGGSLSPRGDWRMPSDASVQAWLDDLQRVPSER